ncbi:Mu transposase C-terminal domain-containing protein [Castellaniella sp.]|uniref:Mu transposase C-terminal domain-containing protein n=1 Tax=Castellaniella sp. TaxID=1955812 RepID=UPI002AFF9697|nr:Mu transposase C-terminal domain-containing protein [Castellaniella sp.]
MTGFSFQKNSRFEHHSEEYKVQRINPDQTSVVAERIIDGQIFCLNINDLLNAFGDGNLRFLNAASNGDEPPLCQRPISELNGFTRAELDRRLAYVAAIRDASPDSMTPESIMPIRDAVARKIADPKPPSFTSIYRWVGCAALQRDFRALIPRYDRRGPKNVRQPSRVVELFEEAAERAFGSSPQATVKRVREELFTLISKENSLRPKNQQYRIPGKSTCYRLFSRLDQYQVSVLREGKRIAMRKFKLSGKGAETSRILERAELDHTPLDLFLIDEKTQLPLGRPTLTMLLDHYSRMPLGYYLGFNAPSTAAVLAALRHAILPKKKQQSSIGLEIKGDWPCHGIPETLVVDNGLEFHSQALEFLAFTLGMRIQYCPKKQPQFKGCVERYLKTINYSFTHLVPGTSFSKYYERGDYDPQEHAVLTLGEFQELLEKWFIDVYAKTVHSTLGTTPLEKWTSSAKSYIPKLPESAQKLISEMGIPCTRHLRHDGLRLHGIYYSGEDLAPILRKFGPGTELTLSYDPSDLGSIRVFDPVSHEIAYTAYAKNFYYANGLSLNQHRLIRQELVRQGRSAEDPVELEQEKQALREKIAELAVSKKHSKRRLAARLRGAQKQVESAKPRIARSVIEKPTPKTSPSFKKSALDAGNRPRIGTFKMHNPGVM